MPGSARDSRAVFGDPAEDLSIERAASLFSERSAALPEGWGVVGESPTTAREVVRSPDVRNSEHFSSFACVWVLV